MHNRKVAVYRHVPAVESESVEFGIEIALFESPSDLNRIWIYFILGGLRYLRRPDTGIYLDNYGSVGRP